MTKTQREYRAVIKRDSDNHVVWVAQPPHYQHSQQAATTYGQRVADGVYGAADHHVETETRVVGPWTKEDVDLLRANAFRDASETIRSCVDLNHAVTLLRALANARRSPVPSDWARSRS